MKDFKYESKPDTCLWCGDKLTFKCHTVKERTEKVRYSKCCPYCKGPVEEYLSKDGDGVRCVEPSCRFDLHPEPVYRIVSRKPIYEKRGPYGDGFFCTMTCAYWFARRLATLGNHLKGNK